MIARRLAAAACALSLATISAQSAPAIAGPDTSVLRSIESQVTQIRGLEPLAAPTVQLLDHQSLHSYLVDQFEHNYLPSERESDQKLLVALGMLEPSQDLVEIQLNLLSDQVVGVYDSDVKSLFVVVDHGGFGPAERITYAHEFNHALQDQHYDLNRIAPKHPLSNDRSLAAHALIEGDAILLQTLWAQRNLSQDELQQLARAAAGSDDSLAQVPLIVRSELLFPYVDGFSFVRQIYRQAGDSFAAIDDLLANPPESTAQVLHIDKYRNQVHPIDVGLPDLATQLGPDWRKVGSGVLGELDTRVVLEQWGSPRSEAMRVTSAWSGDSWQLVEKDGRAAIAWKSTWETPTAASDFFDGFSGALRTRFDAAQVDESSDGRQTLTTPEAATDLRLQGSDVLAVIAFDRESANTIIDALTASAPSAPSSP
jgi:hypothetical protein